MYFHEPKFAILVVCCFIPYPWLPRSGQNALLIAANIIFYLASGLIDSTLFAFVLVCNYLLARRIVDRPDWRTLFAAWVGANLVMVASEAGLIHVFAAIAEADLSGFAGFGGTQYLKINGTFAGIAVVYFVLCHVPRRLTLWTAVLLNLLNLGTFKYANFVLDNAASLSELLGLGWVPAGTIYADLLPLGISFYTFQMIAYQVDLWRQHATPPKHFGEFVLFISFFAQLIAGPILRASQFLPQLENRRRLTLGEFKLGALFIVWGLVKKVIFADTISGYVDTYFGDLSTLQGAAAWAAAIGFSFQIYFDFSGYSDIAVGLGHWFGFQLPRNFHQPYLSRDPREFWQRWHVTLSQWLRDYLYISLGGNRGTYTTMLRNLMITMLLGGLWHGSKWTFVVWGGLHGAWLVGHRLWLRTAVGTRLREQGGPLYKAACHVGVCLFLIVTWVFFRAESLGDALIVLRGMLVLGGGAAVEPLLPGFLLMLAFFHVAEQLVFEDIPRASAKWHRVPAPGRGFVYATTWLLIVIMLKEEAPFIYFRF